MPAPPETLSKGPSVALLTAPQFLDEDDARSHKIDPGVLRWRRSGWEAGEPATRPAAVSSNEAIDAILSRLSHRGLFPNFQEIVLAGHSGGGQNRATLCRSRPPDRRGRNGRHRVALHGRQSFFVRLLRRIPPCLPGLRLPGIQYSSSGIFPVFDTGAYRPVTFR